MSGENRPRLRSQESIHVACAGKVLVTIPLSALLATNGRHGNSV